MTQNRGVFSQNGCFALYAGIFLRSVAALRLSNVSFRKSFRFPEKPTDFVIARRAFSMPDAAILNGTKRHPGTNYAGGKGRETAVGCITISRKNRRSDGTAVILEVPPRFELGSQGFADPCLTTWPRHHMNLSRKKGTRGAFLQLTNGAGDEARTRYLHLGKVALYQMSYTRIWCLRSELNQRHADFQSAALPTELQRHVEPR